jgi:predicted phage terminase large subunit-like protein
MAKETKVQLATQEIAVREALAWRALKLQCEGSLRHFFREAWPQFDSSRFVNNWHLDAIAEHLEAVSHGQIKRLLINIPPRFGKTNLVAIAWPVWTWAHPPDDNYPLLGAGVRFLCASYGANKAEADGVTARRLIGSDWFKERWGDRVQIAKDRDNQSQYDTTIGGSRISTGIPESLGKGGAIRLIDDPHKTDEVESDLVRAATVRAYDEVWRTRSNDPVSGAEVMVMQRLAEGDLSGHLLGENDPNLVHLMLPLEFDTRRICHTVTGFIDPRRADGDLLWPDRFDRVWVANQKRRVGPHAWAGQYNQIPVARGGGIIQRDWWKLWPPEGQEDSWTQDFEVEGRKVRRTIYPDLEFVILACDTAYTEKEENDWSACIAWGVFRDEARNPKIIMLEAWRERLELRALVTKIIATARRRKADAVLIEAKASGLSVMQEIRRLMRDGEFTLFPDVPKGDKLARLHAASPAFSSGLVYAPERSWSELVIDEVASFPRSRFKDLTDCVSSGIKKLRDLGLLQHTDEVQGERDEELMANTTPLRASPREEYGV